MRISNVEIIPIRPRKGLIGFATIEMDKQLLLHSIGIYKRRDGLGYRLTYPKRCNSSMDIPLFHPIVPDLSKEIERCVFNKEKEIFDY